MSANNIDNFCLLESSSLKIWYLSKKRGGRRYCVHEINKSRYPRGEFHHLFSELRNDPQKFHSYFRMSLLTFDYILKKISDKLMKKWTNFNLQPISPTERLAITLR